MGNKSLQQNIIALVDCNSFYCSCERVFQPALQKRPVIVLSNNDGCVVSRTDEAKQLGIKMGEPYFKIKSFCEQKGVAVFSSNYALYGDMSRRVMRTLSMFSPEMEIYSIDEAFLSLSGFSTDKITEYAHMIRNQVRQWTGIPVSIGVGTTKVLAKAANHYAKKNKVKTQGVVNFLDITDPDIILRDISVGDLWGIGRKSVEKLSAFKITTAFDLKYSDERLMQKLLTITGRRIVEELRGRSCHALALELTDKKQIISSRSFGRPVLSLEHLREAVANHVTTAAEKLRKQDSLAQALLVFVQTNPFKKNSPQYYNSATMTLMTGTSVTYKMIRYSFQCLDKIYRKGYEYKKVGVILTDIHKKAPLQLDFFQTYDSPRDNLLMQTLDHINEVQGRGSLKFAACGIEPFWKMLSAMKSRHYSTRWSDLLRVES